MANYCITGVWKSSGVITDVMLHADDGATIGRGSKKTVKEVIALIQNQNKVITIVWNYKDGIWNNGAVVEVIPKINPTYLRTDRDKTAIDNLDNAIKLNQIC